MTLDWHRGGRPLTEAQVASAERALGVRLPASYRDLAARFPGGHPEPSEFTVPSPRRSWISGIGILLSLDPEEPEGVFRCMEYLAVDGQLPAGVIPITDDGGGDMLCLDYRDGRTEPRVVYFAHGLDDEDSLIPVAATFDELLAMLERAADA